MTNLFKWIFRISVSIVLLYVATQLITSKPYMALSENKYASHENITWDYTYATEQIIDYLNGKLDSLEFPSYPGGDDVLMTERGIYHMIDVQVLYKNIRILAATSFVVASITGIYLYDKGKLIESLKKIWVVPTLFTAFLTIAMVLDFRATFTLFHELLFSNDLWLLTWDDPLIVMLPPNFFMLSAMFILGLFILFHILIVLFAYKTSIRK